MEDESALIMLVRQYSSRFGITFSSKAMEDEETKQLHKTMTKRRDNRNFDRRKYNAFIGGLRLHIF